MVELPKVPDLNPDGADDLPLSAAKASAPSPTPSLPTPLPAFAPAAPTPRSTGPLAPGAAAAIKAIAAAPAAPSVSNEEDKMATAEATKEVLDESFEEIISQASEQKLQLVRMEEMVGQMLQVQENLRQEVYTGLQQAKGAGGAAFGSTEELAQRIQEVDDRVARAAKAAVLRFGLLLLVQVAVLVVLLTGTLSSSNRPSSIPDAEPGEPESSSAAVTSTNEEPRTPTLEEATAAEDENNAVDSKGKKRKGKGKKRK